MVKKGVYLAITNAGYLKTISLNGNGVVNRGNNYLKATQKINESYYEFIERNKDKIKQPPKQLLEYAGYQLNDMIRWIEMYLGIQYKTAKTESEIKYTYSDYMNKMKEAYSIYNDNKDRIEMPNDVWQSIIYIFRELFYTQASTFVADIKNDCKFSCYNNLLILDINSVIDKMDYLDMLIDEDLERQVKSIIINNLEFFIKNICGRIKNDEANISSIYQKQKCRITDYDIIFNEPKITIHNINIGNTDNDIIDYNISLDIELTGEVKDIKLRNNNLAQNIKKIKF